MQAFSLIDERSYKEIAELLEGLSESERQQIANALRTVERLLSKNGDLKFSGL